MAQFPVEQASSLQIGTVDFVSPDVIKVVLEIEAPESIALNPGVPLPFPRVNSYLLIPVDDVLLVGQVEWITVEHSPFPKRRGMHDFGLVDLPYPLRRLCLNPLGTLQYRSIDGDCVFQHGTDTLPSVGTGVRLPTESQLRSIFESGEHRRIKIGSSPLAGDAEVFVDPDRLFGRHLAVLGNTGSGKSCSVAGLVRWCLEQSHVQSNNNPNARFVILDPNGEYSQAFDEVQPVGARVFQVSDDGNERALQVPLWFWNSEEWSSFTQASARTQRPTLMQALRLVRDGTIEPAKDRSHEMRIFLRTLMAILTKEKNIGTPWAQYGPRRSFHERLEMSISSMETELEKFEGSQFSSLQMLIRQIKDFCRLQTGHNPNYFFSPQQVQELVQAIGTTHHAFGGTVSDLDSPDIDAPLPFAGASLLRSVEATAELLNVSEYVETLLLRIRGLLADTRMKSILGDESNTTLAQWLEGYIGKDDADGSSCVSVIDLSLVPAETVHIITSVIARIVFEAHQRYVKLNDVSLPTVIVMEEAHTFIRRYREDFENRDAAITCCQVFERIAREGRKFGLGLVLSSQRPSELSPVVLSQCNSFLLHRISNDRDQDLVNRLVPDNLRSLLRELPSLPSQNAILLGWASELPVLVKMNDLPKEQQPRSEDPKFWSVWTRAKKRQVDWNTIADDWQGKISDADEESADWHSDKSDTGNPQDDDLF